MPLKRQWLLVNVGCVGHVSTFHIALTNRDSEFSHRISSLESVPSEVAILKERFGVLEHEVKGMSEAFRSLKTALYSASATILAAAVLVVIMGRAA
jgi:hypothetical protein